MIELVTIPETRNIYYRQDVNGTEIIGKPRFSPANYIWPSELFSKLRNHLLNIWYFFETYSFWFDDILKPILFIDKRRISKKSLIFLLERDVWCTDEVYGDYLIEKKQNSFVISYYRRKQKRKSFTIEKFSEKELEKWICDNAKQQIKDQLTNSWKLLEAEIETCLQEDYARLPFEMLTPDYIIKENAIIKELLPKYPNAALLSLGRLAELWVLQILGKKRRNKKEGRIGLAEGHDLINETQKDLLYSIRKEYNNLKHNLTYNVKNEVIQFLWERFSTLITT